MKGSTARGFKFYIGDYNYRIWWGGFEYGNRLGGRVVLFPWNSYFWKSK